MSRIRFYVLAVATVLVAGMPNLRAQSLAEGRIKSVAPASIMRRDGAPVKVGDGLARTYVLTDEKTGAPIEIGVALSERAMEDLPSQGSGHHQGGESNPSDCGKSLYKRCWIACVTSRKIQHASETTTPMTAESTSRRRYRRLRISSSGSAASLAVRCDFSVPSVVTAVLSRVGAQRQRLLHRGGWAQ